VPRLPSPTSLCRPAVAPYRQFDRAFDKVLAAQAVTLPGVIAKIRHLMPDPEEAIGERCFKRLADLLAFDAARSVIGFGPYEPR